MSTQVTWGEINAGDILVFGPPFSEKAEVVLLSKRYNLIVYDSPRWPDEQTFEYGFFISMYRGLVTHYRDGKVKIKCADLGTLITSFTGEGVFIKEAEHRFFFRCTSGKNRY